MKWGHAWSTHVPQGMYSVKGSIMTSDFGWEVKVLAEGFIVGMRQRGLDNEMSMGKKEPLAFSQSCIRFEGVQSRNDRATTVRRARARS